MEHYISNSYSLKIEIVAKDRKEAQFITNYMMKRPDLFALGSYIEAGILFTRKTPGK